jgi:hypothetical protein
MCSLIVFSALVAFVVVSPAIAQEDLKCDDFQHNPDGSWTPKSTMTIQRPNGGEIRIGPGLSFHTGVPFMGVDRAAMLDKHCH